MKNFSVMHNLPPIQNLPILWKLTLWSSLFLLLLFSSYNTIQYFIINRWMYEQEVNRVYQASIEIKAFFKETKNKNFIQELAKSKDFLTTVNRRNQMIRILDEKGATLFQTTNQVAPHIVPAETVTHLKIFDLMYESDHLLVVRNPFSYDHVTGTVEIIRNLEEFDEFNEMILFYLVLAGIIAVILSGSGGYAISRQVVKPIQQMANTMREIRNKRDEGLAFRVNFFQNGDEFTELASIFNEMMDRLEYSFQQQKQFVEDASHELRTPIAIIEGHLSLLNRWGKKDPNVLDESLTLALEETKRLKLIVMELLELSRAEKVTVTHGASPINPRPIVEKLVLNLRMLHPAFTIVTTLDSLDHLLIRIKSNHLEQILLILLDNAIKYTGSKKMIEIHGEVRQNQLILIIKDYGPGIPKKELPFIFHRFFRADKARSREKSGIGLGLSIAQRLVISYEGTIQVESHEGIGTSFILSFPVVQQLDSHT